MRPPAGSSRVSSKSCRYRRAPMMPAAASASCRRSWTSPPIAPLDSVRMTTVSPAARCDASVAPDADLHVVGVRADRQHRLGGALGGALGATLDRERGDALQEGRGGDGLDQELVGVATQRLDGVVHAGERRHDGHGGAGRAGAQLPQQVEPAHAGHLDVREHDVEGVRRDLGQRGHRLVHHGHVHAAAALQHRAHVLCGVGVVLDDQHPDLLAHPESPSPAGRCGHPRYRWRLTALRLTGAASLGE